MDAYAAQHPGTDTPQARNSAGIHLSRLCLLFDRGRSIERVDEAMVVITARKFAYPWLPPPSPPAGITVADILVTETAAAQTAMVVRWAEAVWKQWSEHHARVRLWMEDV